jgi:tetratricopeptide (TPR) repeat protein
VVCGCDQASADSATGVRGSRPRAPDRGDLSGASADAAEAAKLSPHDGDAWKLWGDVLANQGNRNESLVKYDEAVKFAPNWAALKEAREVAAKHMT